MSSDGIDEDVCVRFSERQSDNNLDDDNSLSRNSVGPSFSRCSESSVHSQSRWWNLLALDPDDSFNDEPTTLLQRGVKGGWRLFNGCWHTGQVYRRHFSWPMLLIFMICWLLVSGAACLTCFKWAQNVETSQRSRTMGVAKELTRFLGREMEQFFIPLYPLRLFVQKTRLLHLSRVVEAFPGSTVKPSPPFRNTSTIQNYPEFQSDFEDVVAGIWDSLDPTLRASILSLQLSPRGVVTLVSPMAGNEGVLGLEVVHESRNQPAVLDAIGRIGPSVVGPLPLIQGAVGVLAYLPVYVDEGVEGAMETQDIPRVGYDVLPGMKWWGFVTAVANLTKMAEWSGAMRDFEYSKMHFKMQSSVEANDVKETHTLFDSEEENFFLDVEIPRIFWTLSVGWDFGFWPTWFWPSIVGSIAGSFMVAFLITITLLSRKKHRLLLYRIMPRNVVNHLHQGRQVVHSFKTVSIFFSDLVGFTDLSSRSSPLEVVAMLNELYTEFDKLAKRHQVFKSDTIGDAYMVVGGAPERCSGPEGAARVTLFALEALELLEARDVGVKMRAGVASGPAVAAVMGTAVPKYSFFGDTVGTANVMESSGRSGRLQVTEQTKELLEQSGVPLDIREAHDGYTRTHGGAGVKTYWVSRPGRGPGQLNARETFPVSPSASPRLAAVRRAAGLGVERSPSTSPARTGLSSESNPPSPLALGPSLGSLEEAKRGAHPALLRHAVSQAASASGHPPPTRSASDSARPLTYPSPSRRRSSGLPNRSPFGLETLQEGKSGERSLNARHSASAGCL